jgi:hypothetical protein
VRPEEAARLEVLGYQQEDCQLLPRGRLLLLRRRLIHHVLNYLANEQRMSLAMRKSLFKN